MSRRERKSMRNRVHKDSQKTMGIGNFYLQLPQGTEFFAVEPGSRCTIDILPYEITDPEHPDRETAEVGDLWYKRPYRLHSFCIGVNNNSAVCPRSIGKPCPVCEYMESILSSKNPDQTVVNALKPKFRVLYNVRPLSGPDKGKIKVWNFSYHNFQKQLNSEIEDPENEKFIGFADLEGGYSLRIRFASETFGEKGKPFARAERIDFRERKDLSENILKEVVNLDKILVVKSYKALQTEFFGTDNPDVDNADTDVSVSDADNAGIDVSVSDEVNESQNTDKKEVCPHGYKWGEADSYDECDNCDKWDMCVGVAL